MMIMKKMTMLLSTPALAGSLLLTGCGSSPCAELGRPSQAEIAAANQGAEIEREVDGWAGETECVVDRGDWVEDDE